MKFKNARTAVAAVAFAALAVCFIAGVATGTWCGFGANDWIGYTLWDTFTRD